MGVNEELYFPSLGLESEDNDTDIHLNDSSNGLRWTANRSMARPINVSSNKKTTIKEEHRTKFTSSLSSFLAFVPVEF